MSSKSKGTNGAFGRGGIRRKVSIAMMKREGRSLLKLLEQITIENAELKEKVAKAEVKA